MKIFDENDGPMEDEQLKDDTMLLVRRPTNREEVNQLLHELLGLAMILPPRMMTIDEESSTPGEPFGDCVGSMVLEVMMLSTYLALQSGDHDRFMELIKDYMVSRKGELDIQDLGDIDEMFKDDVIEVPHDHSV